MKKAMVSSTTMWTCSRHPVPEEMMVVMVCVCSYVCVCVRESVPWKDTETSNSSTCNFPSLAEDSDRVMRRGAEEWLRRWGGGGEDRE